MARTKKVVSKRIRKQQLKECAKKMQELKKARKSLQNEQILPVKSISDLDAIPATNVKETNHLVLETWCNINKSSQLQDHEETHNVDKVSQSSEVIEQQLKQIKDVSNENTRKRKFTDVNNDNNIDKEKPESVNELWDLPCEVATQGQQIEKIKDGNHRIVDFKYFTEELMRISSHKSLFQCSFNTMELISETKKGLVSKFLYECLLCKTRFTIKNTPEDLNTKLIEGTMTAGCGNAQLERITASLDLPSISEHTYSACQNKICQAWETTAWDEMKTAGEREREAAINEGKVTKDGIALIDVIADGCWSKRSYKSNYAALSGAAAIVGRRFGQILFMSVKKQILLHLCQI
ncbi:unnamed protein product [Spodoptera exigua]|nr:unnamed protein product [Spodoptera exigua]